MTAQQGRDFCVVTHLVTSKGFMTMFCFLIKIFHDVVEHHLFANMYLLNLC